MFGLALWDEPRGQLLLARDRTGIKLMYYKLESDRLLFGSEIRAILSAMKQKPEVDSTALSLFLRYRFTPSPLTIFKGIRKLAPGTRLIIDANGNSVVGRWWRFEPKPFSPMPNPEDAIEELEALYHKAVKRHLLSDVPLGLLLSGGIDSGLLLALMNRHGQGWKTFSVGYGNGYADDELADASKTAETMDAHHHAVLLDRDTFEASLAKVISYMEEPIASPSIVPMYHVCQRAREEVKVVLVGQGPDELFGGYKRHLGVYYGKYWRSLPGWSRKALRALLNNRTRIETVQRGLYALDVPHRIKRYQHVLSMVPQETIVSIFHEDYLPIISDDHLIECWEPFLPSLTHTDELGGLQYLEIRSTLPDELLMYADKLSMAHCLEARVPYLDYEIVEYVERLSGALKIRSGKTKWLHRKVCERFLDESMLRRKKRGFGVNVVDRWFRDALSARMSAFFNDKQSLMYRFFRPQPLQQLLRQHQAGRCDNHKLLFSLVVFEEWLRTLH
jgi:asparagine synthase (glutamine-hydrolysing)